MWENLAKTIGMQSNKKIMPNKISLKFAFFPMFLLNYAAVGLSVRAAHGINAKITNFSFCLF